MIHLNLCSITDHPVKVKFFMWAYTTDRRQHSNLQFYCQQFWDKYVFLVLCFFLGRYIFKKYIIKHRKNKPKENHPVPFSLLILLPLVHQILTLLERCLFRWKKKNVVFLVFQFCSQTFVEHRYKKLGCTSWLFKDPRHSSQAYLNYTYSTGTKSS